MAVVNLSSTKQTLFAAGDKLKVSDYSGRLRFYEDTVTCATGDSINSTYTFAGLPSNARIKWGNLTRGDATCDAPDCDLGLKHEGGKWTATGVLGTAFDIDDTGDHLFRGGNGAQDFSQQLWEIGAQTSDVGGLVHPYIELDAAVVAGGIIKIQAYWTLD